MVQTCVRMATTSAAAQRARATAVHLFVKEEAKEVAHQARVVAIQLPVKNVIGEPMEATNAMDINNRPKPKAYASHLKAQAKDY